MQNDTHPKTQEMRDDSGDFAPLMHLTMTCSKNNLGQELNQDWKSYFRTVAQDNQVHLKVWSAVGDGHRHVVVAATGFIQTNKFPSRWKYGWVHKRPFHNGNLGAYLFDKADHYAGSGLGADSFVICTHKRGCGCRRKCVYWA